MEEGLSPVLLSLPHKKVRDQLSQFAQDCLLFCTKNPSSQETPEFWENWDDWSPWTKVRWLERGLFSDPVRRFTPLENSRLRNLRSEITVAQESTLCPGDAFTHATAVAAMGAGFFSPLVREIRLFKSGLPQPPRPRQAFPSLTVTEAPASREDLPCPISCSFSQGSKLCNHQNACTWGPLPGPVPNSLRRDLSYLLIERGLQVAGHAFFFSPSCLFIRNFWLLVSAISILLPLPPRANS